MQLNKKCVRLACFVFRDSLYLCLIIIIYMSTSNIVIAAVFAFRDIGDKQVLSVLVIDGENDSFELPIGMITSADKDVREVVARTLLVDEERGRISITADELLQVPIIEDEAVVYTAVLPEWPGRPKGTNWIAVSPEGTISEELAYNHNSIIKAALDTIVNTLVAPFSQTTSLSPELQTKLWNTLMPETRKSEWLERIKCLGVDSSALSELSDYPSDKIKEELDERLVSEFEELDYEKIEKGEDLPDEKKGAWKWAYNYMHPNLTVDIVVLAVNDKGELVIPLAMKANTERGSGSWGLPGGFVQFEHYIRAGWVPNEPFEFGNDNKGEYLDNIEKGHSVLEEAALDFLNKKAGIVLPDRTPLYPLNTPVQANPRHGVSDGAPIVSFAFLAIVPDYKVFESNVYTSKYVQGLRWFPIHRRLLRNKEVVFEELGQVDKENAVKIDGKEGTFLLSYDCNLSDAYLDNGRLLIDHYQDASSDRTERMEKSSPEREIYGHHGDVIVEALELIKNKTFTSTILADFIIKDSRDSAWNCAANAISFDYFKRVRDAVKCFDPSIRQNLFDKETAKELKVDELVEKLSAMNEKELVATAKKKGLEAIAIKGLSSNEIIERIIERTKEETYQWKDPTGGVHFLINNGFLVKDPSVSRTYFLSKELYQRFLDLGSTL